MFGSTVIDIAIGLVFVYLLLSLICSAINEIIERFARYRAKDLHRGLQELFRDNDWVGRLYNHPLVWGLFEGKYAPGAKNLPSYIPSTTFALTVMDLIAPGEGSSGATGTTTSTPGVVVNVAGEAPPPAVADPLQQLRAGIQGIPSEHVRQALLTLVNAAGKDAAKARENIEGWFNSSMDRVSGWYKRRSQLIVLVAGLVLAAALNADTIAIVRVLSTDRTMRESLVAAAESYAKNPPSTQTAQPATPPAAAPVKSPAPVGSQVPAAREASPEGEASPEVSPESSSPSPSPAAAEGIASVSPTATPAESPATAAAGPASATSGCVGANDTPECRIKENLQEIKKLGLPIGWTRTPEAAGDPRSIYLSNQGWAVRLVGWLITAFAVSLGAPFWFDLLNKFIVIRSTVKPREKSREEQSKD